jgi:hypothetical protein
VNQKYPLVGGEIGSQGVEGYPFRDVWMVNWGYIVEEGNLVADCRGFQRG